MLKRDFVVAVGIATALLTGCEKKEATAPAPAAQQEAAQPTQQAAPPTQAPAVASETFSTTVPAPFADKKFGVRGKANIEFLNKKSVNKSAEVKSGDGFLLDGWAFDDKTKTVPETVAIELFDAKTGSKYYATARRDKRNRADVAQYFKEDAYKTSGIVLNADIGSVPAGEYEVIVVQLIDGKPQRAYPDFKFKKLD